MNPDEKKDTEVPQEPHVNPDTDTLHTDGEHAQGAGVGAEDHTHPAKVGDSADAHASVDAGKETFTCESCGEARPIAQKKQHAAEHAGEDGGEHKNVCEFC